MNDTFRDEDYYVYPATIDDLESAMYEVTSTANHILPRAPVGETCKFWIGYYSVDADPTYFGIHDEFEEQMYLLKRDPTKMVKYHAKGYLNEICSREVAIENIRITEEMR